jgi:hypothetical protein
MALHKANTTKENIRPMIPQLEKGSAGNGFNLQAKIGLKDDEELYGALWVSYSEAESGKSEGGDN